MAELTVSSMPVQLKKMKAKLEKIAKTFNEDFAVDEMVVLWSKKGCEAQKIHTDNVITKSGDVIYVISGVIALENGTKVVFDLGKKKRKLWKLPKGHAFCSGVLNLMVVLLIRDQIIAFILC
jgi:hypothetical protein